MPVACYLDILCSFHDYPRDYHMAPWMTEVQDQFVLIPRRKNSRTLEHFELLMCVMLLLRTANVQVRPQKLLLLSLLTVRFHLDLPLQLTPHCFLHFHQNDRGSFSFWRKHSFCHSQWKCMIINFLDLFFFGIQVTLFRRCQSKGF